MKSEQIRYDAEAVVAVLGDCTWEGAVLAKAYIDSLGGESDKALGKRMAEKLKNVSQKKALGALNAFKASGFNSIKRRARRGSAENPVTKLFPAAIAESLFLEKLEALRVARPSLTYIDERFTEHSHVDFTLVDGEAKLPINVKNAGTLFQKSRELVKLEPDDCLPIATYKAHGAVGSSPELLYVVNVDYKLVGKLEEKLTTFMSEQERLVWRHLNEATGKNVKKAEDKFIYGLVQRRWKDFKDLSDNQDFDVISAKKVLKILAEKPERTPGIGIRAWGTGASSEVNVHVSRKSDMISLTSVFEQIKKAGVQAIVAAVNRTASKEVPDPHL